MQIGADMSDKIDWSIAPDGATHYYFTYYKVAFGNRVYKHTGNYWKKCEFISNDTLHRLETFQQNPSIRSRLLCKLKVTVNRMAAYVGIL